VPQGKLEIALIARENPNNSPRANRFDAKTALVFGALKRHCIRFINQKSASSTFDESSNARYIFSRTTARSICCNYQTS